MEIIRKSLKVLRSGSGRRNAVDIREFVVFGTCLKLVFIFIKPISREVKTVEIILYTRITQIVFILAYPHKLSIRTLIFHHYCSQKVVWLDKSQLDCWKHWIKRRPKITLAHDGLKLTKNEKNKIKHSCIILNLPHKCTVMRNASSPWCRLSVLFFRQYFQLFYFWSLVGILIYLLPLCWVNYKCCIDVCKFRFC